MSNPGWQVLADSQMSMSLHKLLHFLLRFKEMVHCLTNRDLVNPSVNLTASTPGPPLMDSENPVVQLLILVTKFPAALSMAD